MIPGNKGPRENTRDLRLQFPFVGARVEAIIRVTPDHPVLVGRSEHGAVGLVVLVAGERIGERGPVVGTVNFA